MKKPFIGIRIEGGIIQSVFSSHPDIVGKNFIIIDYDTEGADPEDISKVEQSDGSYNEAYVTVDTIATAEMEADDFMPPLEEIR